MENQQVLLEMRSSLGVPESPVKDQWHNFRRSSPPEHQGANG